MHCPKCGQQQAAEDTRFCSRCGFSLGAVSLVIANEGELPISHIEATEPDARKNGLKQGLFVMLLAVVIVPLLTAIAIGLRFGPTIPLIALILLLGGGFLRLAYAFLFEASTPTHKTVANGSSARNAFETKNNEERRSFPSAAYTAPAREGWRAETNDLATPSSVTESTTRLL